jgi:DNA protecting protein DprA
MPRHTLFGDELDGPDDAAKLPFAVVLLALASIKGLGQKGIESLVSRFGDGIGRIFGEREKDLTETLKSCGIAGADKFANIIREFSPQLLERGEQELVYLGIRNVHVIRPSALPERLRSINGDSPKWLFVEGAVAALDTRPVVAVVGTRHPSEQGMEAARIIARVLSPYPVLVVSGLAEGIDGQVHYHSLHFGVKNVAFVGHGINLTFPEVTAPLRHDIVAQGGAVVSEYLPGQTYQKRQFVARNRLQAAIADLVIPVEAAATSGTAHTIRYARRYGRPLVGMVWKGANGIVDDLRENNDRLIDIFSSAGQRELDQIIKDILTAEKADTYPFKRLERSITQEIGNRTHTEADIQRLIDTIQKTAAKRKQQEPPPNGTT